MAELIRGLSDNGGIVFCGIDSTDIVCKAEELHKTSATCSAALGRLLTGAALMGSMLKDDRDSITLRVNGGGPAGLLIACTDGTGNVKGCIDHPLVELPPRADGHLDVGGAVGKDGVLTVIRDNRLQKEPTVGQVPLVSGEIAEDLTYYFAVSEQVPSSVGLGVLMEGDNTVRCAGGFIVQVMPFVEDKVLDKLEENIGKIRPVTAMLDNGHTPEEMLREVLEGLDVEFADTLPAQFSCNCSKERIEKAIISIGKKEIQSMIDDGKDIEVKCHFCNTAYNYTVDELKELLKKAKV